VSLLSRVRPDLQPRQDNVPARVERPEVERDHRPIWIQRRDSGQLPAKELAGWR
jgi:hypothetical protein